MSDQNFLFGRGKVYLALESDGFDPPNYRYLGQTPGFEITQTPERIQLKSSDGPTRETLASVVIDVESTGTLSCHNVDKENQALFFSGVTESITQSAGVFSFEIEDIKQDRYYFIGESNGNAGGFKDIFDVAISGSVEGVDFDVDASIGKIYIIPGGNIANGSTKTVTGEKPLLTFVRVSSSDAGAVVGRLKFEADNASGNNDLLILPSISLAPSGSYAPQSEDFVTIDFEFEILKTSQERIIIDGVPVA
jgi:hypothetical protein